VVVGCYGLLRGAEIESLTFEQMKFEGEICFVTVQRKKHGGSLKASTFAITDPVCVSIIRQYCDFFTESERTGRLFRYLNSGRSTNRPIGKNKLSKYPQDVAKFLGLDPTGYSGHCWRRTGATILAEADVSLIQLKHAGGWRSDQVCQEYVEESKNEKIKIASRLSFFEDNSQASLPARALTEQLPSINVDMSNCSGSCVFNYFTPFHQISLEKFK
jgi:hypothetical protein